MAVTGFNPEVVEGVVLPYEQIQASIGAVIRTIQAAGVEAPSAAYAIDETGVTRGVPAEVDFTAQNVGPYDKLRFLIRQTEQTVLLWAVQGYRGDGSFHQDKLVQLIDKRSTLQHQGTHFTRSSAGRIAVLRQVLLPADYATPDRRLRELFHMAPVHYDL